jgi:hypothetical protein
VKRGRERFLENRPRKPLTPHTPQQNQISYQLYWFLIEIPGLCLVRIFSTSSIAIIRLCQMRVLLSDYFVKHNRLSEELEGFLLLP